MCVCICESLNKYFTVYLHDLSVIVYIMIKKYKICQPEIHVQLFICSQPTVTWSRGPMVVLMVGLATVIAASTTFQQPWVGQELRWVSFSFLIKPLLTVTNYIKNFCSLSLSTEEKLLVHGGKPCISAQQQWVPDNSGTDCPSWLPPNLDWRNWCTPGILFIIRQYLLGV